MKRDELVLRLFCVGEWEDARPDGVCQEYEDCKQYNTYLQYITVIHTYIHTYILRTPPLHPLHIHSLCTYSPNTLPCRPRLSPPKPSVMGTTPCRPAR
jgi:hypothetical protein